MKHIIYLYILLFTLVSVFPSCYERRYGPALSSEVTVVGMVVFSGSDPFERMVFVSDSTGTSWMVENRDVANELYGLAGFTVRVTGTFMGNGEDGLRLFVKEYELMPGSGCKAVGGVIREYSGELVLEQPRLSRMILLKGELVPALRNFTGHKVWLCGDADRIECGSHAVRATGVGKGELRLDNRGSGGRVELRKREDLLRISDTLFVQAYWVL